MFHFHLYTPLFNTYGLLIFDANVSALIYSVIQTSIANNLKPLYYLGYVFEQIQINYTLQVSDLLPWSEKIPEKCKNLKTSQHQ